MTSSPHRNFERFLSKALQNAETQAAYEDAQSRSRLVDALVHMRRRLGLTQSHVAASMGVKQPTISGFETEGSDPRLSTIQRYARSVDAVFVWELRPRSQVVRADAYQSQHANHFYNHRTRVNRQASSSRARSWTPRTDYAA